MNEDNFYIKYFCNRLEGNMRDYQKHYYGLKYSSRKGYKRCNDCGGLFEFRAKNQKRCIDCQKKYNRKNKTEKQRKYRVEKLKT